MYVITEADASAIREAHATGGELSVAIAGWMPLPKLPRRGVEAKPVPADYLAERPAGGRASDGSTAKGKP